MSFIPFPDTKNRFTSGNVCRFGNFIVGVIREQSILRIFAPGRQSAVARNKHPVIRVADDAHKKGTHCIVIRNFEVAFIFKFSYLHFNFFLYTLLCVI